MAAIEKSTIVYTVSFTNEDGASVVPNTVVWTLSDSSGAIINGRQDVSVTPAASVDIVLTGDDLEINSSDLSRNLTIEADYDSAAGTGLALNSEYSFNITPLVNVS